MNICSPLLAVTDDERLFVTRIITFAFVLAIAGMLLLLIVPKEDERLRRVGTAFFVGGMAGIAGFFLLLNPHVVTYFAEHIGLTLIGMLIATVEILRLAKK